MGDVDQDGDTDLITFDNGTFPLVIYANDGKGVFTRKAGAITAPATGKAIYGNIGLATVTDIDNDGVADILAEGLQFFHVLRGTGDGNFELANQNWGNIVNTGNLPDSGFAFGESTATAIWTSSATRLRVVRPTAERLSQRSSQAELGEGPAGRPARQSRRSGCKDQRVRGRDDQVLWFDEVIIRAKQVQQNYYSFADTERHFGLGLARERRRHGAFYPSNKEVKQSGVAANNTVRIGEDGMGMIVPPTQVTPFERRRIPGGTDDSGAAEGNLYRRAAGRNRDGLHGAGGARSAGARRSADRRWCKQRAAHDRRGRGDAPAASTQTSQDGIAWLLRLPR